VKCTVLPLTIILALLLLGPNLLAQQSDRELARLLVGAWRSSRHDYVYLADGTWWLGKPDPRPNPLVSHGRWYIKNHFLIEDDAEENGGFSKPEKDLIKKLDRHEIIFGPGFEMKRIRLEDADQYW
jgi:hypothetical protein